MSVIPVPVRVLPAAVDHRGRSLSDLRLSVLDRCNFRCPYCMPAERFPEGHRFLAPAARMSLDEMLLMVECFVALGVRKLRITGGEPLLYKPLSRLIAQLSQRWPQLDLALTTNGSLLAAQVETLRAAGLKRATISLDALDPAVFATLSGGHGRVDEVLRGIAQARALDLDPVKINCVIQRSSNLGQVLPLIEHFRHSGCVLRFIEYMDVGTVNGWQAEDVVSAQELRELIASRHALRALPRRSRSDVAQRWSLADGSLELGFISSVSEPFCGDCTRARLSADGHLYTCLFSRSGHDLLSILRSGGDAQMLQAAIHAIWSGREDRYSEQRAGLGIESPKAEMYHLGG